MSYSGEDFFKPSAIDLSNHLSDVAKARKISPLKSLQRYLGKPGLLMMSGGLPNPSYFPFSQITSEALVPDTFPLTPGCPSSSAFSWFFRLFHASGIPANEKTMHLEIPKYPAHPEDVNLAVALQYGMAKGLPQLQKIMDELTVKLLKPAYEDYTILVHAGNTDGYVNINTYKDPFRWFKCVQTLCNPGDGVLVSEWTYPSAIATIAPFGIQPVAVPLDGQGMSSTNGLRELLSGWDAVARKMPRPHVMYIVPIGQNPTGATMGLQCKREIYEICVEFDIIIVEDDPYYFLQEGPYLPKAERSSTVKAR